MKKIAILLAACLAFCALPVLAEPPSYTTSDDVKRIFKELTGGQKAFECPYSHFSDQSKCFTCHGQGRDFLKIKETDPHALFDYPSRTKVLNDEQGEYGHFSIVGEISLSDSEALLDCLHYLDRREIDRLVISITSYGGGLFSGWQVKALIEEWQAKGFDITTRVDSIAASAAFIIFLSGDKRIVSPTAELMQHELWTFKWLDISTPADKEDEARVLRHIQDTITAWLASRSGISKKELDAKLRKKEYWVNGAQAVVLGWATGFIVPAKNIQDLIQSVERF
jgi:ATP-dependent protease ClpP protease subunit